MDNNLFVLESVAEDILHTEFNYDFSTENFIDYGSIKGINISFKDRLCGLNDFKKELEDNILPLANKFNEEFEEELTLKIEHEEYSSIYILNITYKA